ncbi:MAG: hypothetical protein K2Y12_02905 [Chitinophagaceae bacterium]|jgi:hypothetical protein|nr:hypothetical protein [Chitinophagaceae bacterium]
MLIRSLVFFFVLCSYSCDQEVNRTLGKRHVYIEGKKTKRIWDFERNIYRILIASKTTGIKSLSNFELYNDYQDPLLFRFGDGSFSKIINDELVNILSNCNGKFVIPDKIMASKIINEDSILFYGFRSKKIYSISDSKCISSVLDSGFAISTIYRGFFTDSSFLYLDNDINGNASFCLKAIRNKEKICRFRIDSLLGIKSHNKDNFQMIVDGNFYSSPESKFIIYKCFYSSDYFVFERNTAKFMFSGKTIDSTPLPVIEYKFLTPKYTEVVVKPETNYFRTSSVAGSKFYTYNFISSDGSQYIDIYKIYNNRMIYEMSFQFDETLRSDPVVSISTKGKWLYTLFNSGKLCKYEL